MTDIRLADAVGNKTWTGAKMEWLECIAFDERLIPTDFKVAFVIVQYVHEKTGECFPSEETIAFRCGGLSIRHVRRSLNRLCKTGWLKRKRRWHTSTVYTPLHTNVNKTLDAMIVAREERKAA